MQSQVAGYHGSPDDGSADNGSPEDGSQGIRVPREMSLKGMGPVYFGSCCTLVDTYSKSTTM